MDTVVFSIHNVSYNYPIIADKIRNSKEGISTFAVKDSAFLFRRNNNNMTVNFMSYRNFVKLPSSEERVNYSYDTIRDRITVNFSVPKFLYSTSIFQAIDHMHISNAQNYVNHLLYQYNTLFSSIKWLIRSFIDVPRQQIKLKDVTIDRLDYAINQKFKTVTDLDSYFERQKLHSKKYQREGTENDLRNGTSIEYYNKDYKFKIYKKGAEFKKTYSGERNNDYNYLQSYADLVLRYEITCRNSKLNDLLVQGYTHFKDAKKVVYYFNDCQKLFDSLPQKRMLLPNEKRRHGIDYLTHIELKQLDEFKIEQLIIINKYKLFSSKKYAYYKVFTKWSVFQTKEQIDSVLIAFKQFNRALPLTLSRNDAWTSTAPLINRQKDFFSFDLFYNIVQEFFTHFDNFQITDMPTDTNIESALSSYNANLSAKSRSSIYKVFKPKKAKPILRFIASYKLYGDWKKLLDSGLYSSSQFYELKSLLKQMFSNINFDLQYRVTVNDKKENIYSTYLDDMKFDYTFKQLFNKFKLLNLKTL